MKVGICVCLALECLFVPWFLRRSWPKKTRASLVLKMICSTLFVTVGILALQSRGSESAYARSVLLGLCAGWLGDFLLHVHAHKAFFTVGAFSFLVGHVFYIRAFSSALTTMVPTSGFFSLPELLAFVVLFIPILLYALVRKVNIKLILCFALPYGGTIVFMLVKGWSLALHMMNAGAHNAVFVLPLLCIGSALFLLSDALLALMHVKAYKKFGFKVVNIVTYYAAQLMIALSILFV